MSQHCGILLDLFNREGGPFSLLVLGFFVQRVWDTHDLKLWAETRVREDQVNTRELDFTLLISDNKSLFIVHLSCSKLRRFHVTVSISSIKVAVMDIKHFASFKRLFIQNHEAVNKEGKQYWSGYIYYTAWKLSILGVLLVRIFQHLDWIWRDTESVRMR